MAQLVSLQELQRCSAVPNFVQIFNVLHADYLSLPKLDIDEYEYSLLPAEVRNPEDVHDPTILPNIIIKLLKGCGQAYVREETCYDILRSLALRKWHIYANPSLPCPFVRTTVETAAETVPEEPPIIQPLECVTVATDHNPAVLEPMQVNLIDESNNSDHKLALVHEKPADSIENGISFGAVADVPAPILQFGTVSPAIKAEVMLVLLNSWMMGHLIKTNFIDNIDPNLLRTVPCGHDQRGNNYFYFFGTRLYKETNAKFDPVTGTGSFDWELVAADIEGFGAVLAGLKKTGSAVKCKALIKHLETVVIPGLPAVFEEKHQHDLQRRMEFRRRRSSALLQAKEKARVERQEAAAARSAKRSKQEDDGVDRGDSCWSEKRVSTAASRAERYKRRSQLFGVNEDSFMGPSSSNGPYHSQQKYERVARLPETKEELSEKTERLLLEWLTRRTVQWPVV